MRRAQLARTAAVVGIAGSAAFAAALLLEQAHATGRAHTLANVLVLPGFVGFAAISFALIAIRAGGGRFGQVALGIWFAGPIALLVGGAVEATTGNHDNLFYPAGGLLATLRGLLAAIPVARAGVLRGWRRWAAPALAGYYLLILVLNIAGGDDWNQPLLELGWPLLAAATGAAVLSEPAPRPVPAEPVPA
jgi:hypothetical protein